MGAKSTVRRNSIRKQTRTAGRIPPAISPVEIAEASYDEVMKSLGFPVGGFDVVIRGRRDTRGPLPGEPSYDEWMKACLDLERAVDALPRPDGWEGNPPRQEFKTLVDVLAWFEYKIADIRRLISEGWGGSQAFFLGPHKTALRNACRALDSLGIADRPQMPGDLPDDAIVIEREMDGLLCWVRRKLAVQTDNKRRKAGRHRTNDDLRDFVSKKRESATKAKWPDLAIDWLAKHPDDERFSGRSPEEMGEYLKDVCKKRPPSGAK